MTAWFDVQFRTDWLAAPPTGAWRLAGLPAEGTGGGPVLFASAAFPAAAGQTVVEVVGSAVRFVKHAEGADSVHLAAGDVAAAGSDAPIRVRAQAVYRIG